MKFAKSSNAQDLKYMSSNGRSICFPLAFAGLLAVSILAAAAPVQASQNSIGTATLTQGTCQNTGLANGSCYRAVVSGCPEATGDFAAAVKINQPANVNQVRGTVFFTTGGTGSSFYDYDSEFQGDIRCSGSNCGLFVVEQINAANYRTVQIDFVDPEQQISEPDGWLTGPSTDGPRALACRYATVVHAVWTLLLHSDSAHPVCATGNSGGAALIAYAITQYGMGNASGPGPMFSMVEATSGPPYGRIDRGCAGMAAPDPSAGCPKGVKISEDYGIETAQDYVDPAYPSPVCSTDINSNGKTVDASFRHDSVVSDDFPRPTYQTVVRMLLGSQDLSAAVPLSTEWYNVIKSSKSAMCISGAPHALPGNFDGAEAIVKDVTTRCK
jgi:hypothetical protein